MTIEMKTLLKYVLVVSVYALLVFAIIGCAEQLTPQPQIHPTAGTSVMFIPKGTKIGDQIAPENGIYIGESKLIENMIR